jgi:Domain of unknown function (DUF4864)
MARESHGANRCTGLERKATRVRWKPGFWRSAPADRGRISATGIVEPGRSEAGGTGHWPVAAEAFRVMLPAMRLLPVLLCATALVLRAAEPAAPHYSKPAVRQELVAVVEGQLAAFRANKFEQAFGFAAQAMREQLTVEEFAAMITRGYPVILHNERAEFGLPQDDGASASMPVQVFAGGKSVAYRYSFVKESAGWRISGVLPEKPRASDA